jgi:hypothetical protein
MLKILTAKEYKLVSIQQNIMLKILAAKKIRQQNIA